MQINYESCSLLHVKLTKKVNLQDRRTIEVKNKKSDVAITRPPAILYSSLTQIYNIKYRYSQIMLTTIFQSYYIRKLQN